MEMNYGRRLTRFVHDGATYLDRFNCNEFKTTTDYNLGILWLFNHHRNLAFKALDIGISEMNYMNGTPYHEILLPYINGTISEIKSCVLSRLAIPKLTIKQSKDEKTEWIISIIKNNYKYEFDPSKYGCGRKTYTIGEMIEDVELNLRHAYNCASGSEERLSIIFEYGEFLKGLKEVNCIPPDIMKLIRELTD